MIINSSSSSLQVSLLLIASENPFLKVRKAKQCKSITPAALPFSPLPDFQSDNFAGESDCGFQPMKKPRCRWKFAQKNTWPLEQLNKTPSTLTEKKIPRLMGEIGVSNVFFFKTAPCLKRMLKAYFFAYAPILKTRLIKI